MFSCYICHRLAGIYRKGILLRYGAIVAWDFGKNVQVISMEIQKTAIFDEEDRRTVYVLSMF